MRDLVLTIRFKPDQMKRLRTLADANGRKPSTYMKDLLINTKFEDEKCQPDQPKTKIEELTIPI